MLHGRRGSCIKKIAISEPLVDTVNPEQLCTKTCQLKSFDIHTVQKEDLSFSTNWQLVSLPPVLSMALW